MEEIILSGTRLRSFPKRYLSDLDSIKTINLSTNLITKLGSLTKFHRLENLNLNFNKLGSITGLKKLCRLKTLSLSGNKIGRIDDTAFSKLELETLDLSFNNLDDLPSSLFSLHKLRKLKLNNNYIDTFYSGFSYLENLEHLDLSSNNITVIGKEISKLKHLKSLSLADNQIKSLPLEIGELANLVHLNVNGNELSNIPKEIVNQGNEAILNYLRSASDSRGVDFLYEAKMVIVGRGGVGKTTLVKKLTDSLFEFCDSNVNSTEGIEISQFQFPKELKNGDNFLFHIWDFAGQEKYDATHQFFLTDRSLYLFLTEARQESNYLDFDYWLNIIRLLSKGSPVIVVQAKVDIRLKNLPTELYHKQFRNITDFVNVSVSDDYEHTIEALKKAIANSIDYLPQVGDKLPIEWIEIRHELEAESRDYISLDEYYLICERKGLSKDKANYLSSYFHILGVTVHFQQDLLLKKTVIINPDWAVDGVYAVLDSKEAQESNGKIRTAELENIWSNPRFDSKKPELLALMKNFGICFPISSDTYIIPELLSANPKKYDFRITKYSIRFWYKYDFMPAGILTRFIVKVNQYIVNKNFWKHGVLLSLEDSRAEIIEDYQTKHIKIVVNGDRKKELLAIIRKEFGEIHNEFHNLICSEMIPCNCRQCNLNETPHFFKYKVLRKFELKGKTHITCENSAEDVKIQELINDTIKINETEIIKPSQKSVQNYYGNSVQIINSIIDSSYTINKHENDLIRLFEKYAEDEKEKKDLLISLQNLKNQTEETEHYYQRIQSFLLRHVSNIGDSVVGGILIELGKLALSN